MKQSKLPYYRNCTDFDSDSDVEQLIKMNDESIYVSWETFKKHVDINHLRKLFPYYYWRGHNKKKDGLVFPLWDDWSVTFHRSKLFGSTVYFVRHSAIEYIFSVQGVYKELGVIIDGI